MTARAMRRVAAGAALLAAAACGDSTGPKAGNLAVSLTGAVPARSAQFRVVGPQTGVSAGSANLRVFVTVLGGDTAMVAVIATVGHTLSESNMATLAVPDIGAAALYKVTLLQVAAANYSLQPVSAYTVTVQ